MPLTNYQENANLQALLSSSVYMGFSTTTPTKVGGNITEPVGNNYSLTEVVTGSWNAAAVGAKDNSAVLSSPVASGSWGTLTHVVFYDDASRTNCIAWAALDVAKAISTDEYLRFIASALTWQYAQS